MGIEFFGRNNLTNRKHIRHHLGERNDHATEAPRTYGVNLKFNLGRKPKGVSHSRHTAAARNPDVPGCVGVDATSSAAGTATSASTGLLRSRKPPRAGERG